MVGLLVLMNKYIYWFAQGKVQAVLGLRTSKPYVKHNVA